MKNMSPDQLRELAEAAAALDDYAATVADRDNRIRRAHAAGMDKTEIAARIKASPNTVIKVLGDDEALVALRQELGRPLTAGDLARLRVERIAHELLPLYDRSVSGPGAAILEQVKQYTPQEAARIIARINELAGA